MGKQGGNITKVTARRDKKGHAQYIVTIPKSIVLMLGLENAAVEWCLKNPDEILLKIHRKEVKEDA